MAAARRWSARLRCAPRSPYTAWRTSRCGKDTRQPDGVSSSSRIPARSASPSAAAAAVVPATAATSTSVLCSPSTAAAATTSRAAAERAASRSWITSASDRGARTNPPGSFSVSSVSSARSARASSGLPPVYCPSLRNVRSESPARPRARHSIPTSSASSPVSVSRAQRRSPLTKRSHPSPSWGIPPGRHVRTTSTRSAPSRRQANRRARADARSIHCRSSITTATASPSCREESRASSSTPTLSGSASARGPWQSNSRPASAPAETAAAPAASCCTTP